jgi:hypothetical protein
MSNLLTMSRMNAIFWYDVPPLVTNNFYIWWNSSCLTNFRERETSTRTTLISDLEEFESWNQIFILSWWHCLRYLEIESRLCFIWNLLYNTGSTIFIKGQTSYLEYKSKFHFGQGSIIIKLQIILLRQSGHFLDIFSTWTLNNFGCRVYIELFE